MKYRLRILSMVLIVCIMFCSLTSCTLSDVKRVVKRALYALDGGKQTVETTITFEGDATAPDTETETTSVSNPDAAPEQVVSDLEFCLTNEDVEEYYELIKLCEAAFLNAESTEEELTDIEDRFVESYYHIVTQSQVAYLWYCMDSEDEKRSDDYLFASDASSDAYDAYMQLCKRMDVSNSPLRDRFFEGWTAAELEEMRGFSGEVTELEKANDQIMVKYRQLSDNAFYNGAADYYAQLVKNNNRIAELMGYENYWVYAYEKEYRRDYGETEVAKMRQYVQNYLVPLCERSMNAFQTRYAALTVEEKVLVADLLVYGDYDDFSVDYVGDYLATFDEDRAADMLSLFDADNSFFGVAEGAHQGAFTTYLYNLNRPVCYFGPGYCGMDTIVHEMGHYYSYLVNGTSDIHMDLAEVQSQGNEWLFWYYLNTVLSEDVAQAIYAYCMYDSLGTVIVGTMIDEFEQLCYEEGITSGAQADAIMQDVKSRYGGEAWLENCVTDMDIYWRYVTVEQSVYYVSYAVSMLAAMQIYTVAENQSYETAMELYLSLIDPVSASLLECLVEAELKTPMDEELYLELIAMM